jgi:hypothetical protein
LRPLVAVGLVGLAALSRGAEEPSVRLIKAHYTAREQQAARYVNVPFEVSAGVTRVEVELKYDRAGGENVVDLGLMEPGSVALGTKAFRGWTGGERSVIFVSASDATPGYWPGPIQPGTWRVGLGLYKVGALGVDVEVTVRTTSSEAASGVAPPLPARPAEPIRTGPAWYSGQLHAHTHNSDGALSPQALAEKAKAAGLDFLAITDHNNTAHQRETINVPGLLTIVGEEVTTPGGHMNVWGLGGVRDFIDFRVSPGDPAIATLVKTALTKNAVAGINHPYASCVACSWTHSVPTGISTIEITGREPEEMPRAVALWDMLLRQGRRVTAVGVSDWHRGDAPLGAASVRVFAPDLSTGSILEGVRSGRVVVMAEGSLTPPDLRVTSGSSEARLGDTLSLKKGDAFDVTVDVGSAPPYQTASVELYWNGERVSIARVGAGKVRFERFASTSGYLRVHVVTATGAPMAVTNPVWIKTIAR